MSLVLAMFAMAAMADSPLTSTVFHPCYADVAMVAQAAALKGQDMNPQVAAYLADNTQPVDQRAAVVNALGWNSDGTNNGKILPGSNASISVIVRATPVDGNSANDKAKMVRNLLILTQQ